jgi:hypothetical protein
MENCSRFLKSKEKNGPKEIGIGRLDPFSLNSSPNMIHRIWWLPLRKNLIKMAIIKVSIVNLENKI